MDDSRDPVQYSRAAFIACHTYSEVKQDRPRMLVMLFQKGERWRRGSGPGGRAWESATVEVVDGSGCDICAVCGGSSRLPVPAGCGVGFGLKLEMGGQLGWKTGRQTGSVLVVQ